MSPRPREEPDVYIAPINIGYHRVAFGRASGALPAKDMKSMVLAVEPRSDINKLIVDTIGQAVFMRANRPLVPWSCHPARENI
jgi:hypothetical protein